MAVGRVNRKNSSALGAAGVALIEAEILLYTDFEPARPAFDSGIDLRAISPKGHTVNLQVKTATDRSFGVERRWEGLPNFLLALVWNLTSRTKADVYVLSFQDAIGIIEACAPTWLQSASWRGEIQGRAGFSTRSPNQKILAAIEAYRATPERWREALTRAAAPTAAAF